MASQETLPVAAARAGDPDAWAVLFRRFRLPLYAYVVELVRNEQTALDIVQETFVNATRYIRSLQDDARFAGWLFSIAHQKCQQHWRKPRRDEVPPEDYEGEFGADEASPDDLLIRAEDEQEFLRLLDALSEVHRSVLLLFILEDFGLEEIARIQEVSVGTVKSRLHYAKKQVRKLLKEKQ